MSSSPSLSLAISSNLSHPFSNLVHKGKQALLKRDLDTANWALDTVIFLDPSLTSHLWQRGLCQYYSSNYSQGMIQFERDMDVNGGDIEEVLWHFICKASLMGFKEALKDGFLPLRDHTQTPPPMTHVLDLYKGNGNIDDIITISTSMTPNEIIPSYNGVNALGYAHFYIGIYYQLQGESSKGLSHLKQAIQIGNNDYMGQLMNVHFNIYRDTLLREHLTDIGESVIYGGWQLSSGHCIASSKDKHLVVSKLLQVIDEGITVFDCGDIYTGVEELYGLMIQGHQERGGKRKDLKINTKFVPDLDVIKRGGVDEEYIRNIVSRSLNRLRTSYIDLIQFHWWDWSCAGYIGVVKVLSRLQEEDLVKEIGLTNCDLEHVKEIAKETKITSIQVQLSLLDHRPIDSGLLSYCVEHDISVLSYGVLAGGFLTDQWRNVPESSSTLEFSNRSLIKYWLILKEFGTWDLFQELLSVLHSIALRHSPLNVQLYDDYSTCVDHVTVAMVAIAYVLRMAGVSGVILSSLNISHIKESLMATQLLLSEQDLHDIDEVVKKRHGPGGVVFGLERQFDGPHGSIMKYNLNQLNGPAHLEEICTRFIELHLSAYPVEGTRLGYRYCHTPEETTPTKPHPSDHTPNSPTNRYSKYATSVLSYDDKLNIVIQEQINNYITKVKNLLIETQHISDDLLSIDQKIDCEIIISQLNLELVKWLEVRFHEKDPAYYLPFDAINYLLPSWGPEGSENTSNSVHPGVSLTSIEYRLNCLLSRLRLIPFVLKTGLKNLVKPVKLLTERAMPLCDKLEEFLKSNLPVLVHSMTPSSTQYKELIDEIIEVSFIASAAVSKYKISLNEIVLPKASNDHLSVGREIYDKLLKFGHFINDSESLLKLGQEHFNCVKRQLNELAHCIDPTKTWHEITRDTIRPLHPTASDLLSSYLAEIDRAREHMIDKDLVPELPQGERVLGFYTPQFLVPFSPFGDFLNPSPFATTNHVPNDDNDDTSLEEPNALTGHLMLHSVSAKSLSSQDEDKLLSSHDYTWISVIAPHECYPGHHVQALLAQKHTRIIRKFYESTYFYEGWGLYCEQLAYETGFFKKDVKLKNNDITITSERYEQFTRLTQLRLQLWRTARIILDIKLHRNEMNYEECRQFLCNEIMFDACSVDGEVFMYVSRPTYAPCYVAGYVEILKLREKEKEKCLKEEKEFNLKEFHQKILQTGCLPFPLLEKILNHKN